jgi:ClpP class serine protease
VDLLNLFWIFLVISSVWPMLQRRLLDMARIRAIQRLERLRGSRVITLIHRQESMALLGFPIARYIDIDDSEQILRAIHLTPPDLPIDMVLHTPGGLVLAAEQIAHALIRHRGKVTVFIPHYAMSGGTLLSLACDEIVMDPNAVLGPVDPQLGEYPAASVLAVLDVKEMSDIEDKTLILADVARKALRQVEASVLEVLTANNMEKAKAAEIAEVLSSGRWTHDYPISFEEAQALGMPVSTGLPLEVYQLMELYPQPTRRGQSVQYIPLPYPARDGEQAPKR